MPRQYEPWREKHKVPRGFGTRCPTLMSRERAQELLATAITLPDDAGRTYWNVDGDRILVARPTRLEKDVWHGYPVPGAEVDERVLRALEDAGLLSKAQRRKFRRQAELPPEDA